MDKQRQLQPDSNKSQRCGIGSARKADKEQPEPPPPQGWGASGRPQAGGRSRSLSQERTSRQHQGQLPRLSPQPPTTARAQRWRRALPPPAHAPRARDRAGAARAPLAGNRPGRPEPRPRSELARGSRLGTQSPRAGLRGLARARLARPALAGSAAAAWARAAVTSCAPPETDTGPPRHVRASPRRAGATPFPWFKVRAERGRGSRGVRAEVARGAPPAGCPSRLERPQQPGPAALR